MLSSTVITVFGPSPSDKFSVKFTHPPSTLFLRSDNSNKSNEFAKMVKVFILGASGFIGCEFSSLLIGVISNFCP